MPTDRNKSKSVWNSPYIAIIALLLLILTLLVALLGMTGLILTAEDSTVATTAGASTSSLTSNDRQSSPNFTEWADGVAQNVFQLLNSTSPQ